MGDFFRAIGSRFLFFLLVKPSLTLSFWYGRIFFLPILASPSGKNFSDFIFVSFSLIYVSFSKLFTKWSRSLFDLSLNVIFLLSLFWRALSSFFLSSLAPQLFLSFILLIKPRTFVHLPFSGWPTFFNQLWKLVIPIADFHMILFDLPLTWWLVRYMLFALPLFIPRDRQLDCQFFLYSKKMQCVC